MTLIRRRRRSQYTECVLHYKVRMCTDMGLSTHTSRNPKHVERGNRMHTNSTHPFDDDGFSGLLPPPPPPPDVPHPKPCLHPHTHSMQEIASVYEKLSDDATLELLLAGPRRRRRRRRGDGGWPGEQFKEKFHSSFCKIIARRSGLHCAIRLLL